MNYMTEAPNWILRWVALLALGIFLAYLILQVFALFLEEMGVWKEKPSEKDQMTKEDRRRKEQEDQRRREQMSDEDRRREDEQRRWADEQRTLEAEQRRRDDLRRRNLRPGVWIEANWGGLGGGLSGWRVSNAITYFLLMSFLLGCLSLAFFSLAPVSEKGDVNKQEAQPEQKSDTVKKGDQNKEADKQDDQNAAKQGEATQSDRKPDEAKTPDSSTGDEDLKRSSDAPAANKKTEP